MKKLQGGADVALRLDRYVSQACAVSRSEARKLILAGLVTADGRVCRDPGARLEAPALEVRGQAVSYRPYVYIMLNKPAGVLSASRDRRQTTVADLVKSAFPRRELFPAGRLDKDSEGLILLTDDGPLAHRLLAPRHHISKTYHVTLDTPFTREMADGFAAGLTLKDETPLAPALAVAGPTPIQCIVTLTEGKYHQIKRAFGLFDAGVNALRRVTMGPLSLDEGLAPGEWRELTPEELAALQAL